MNKEDLDEMSNAYAKVDHNFKFGSLVGTGIKLKAFNTTTNKPTTSGLMLSNSDMEILAVSDVKIEVVGYKELEAKYLEAIEALKTIYDYLEPDLCKIPDSIRHKIEDALKGCEVK